MINIKRFYLSCLCITSLYGCKQIADDLDGDKPIREAITPQDEALPEASSQFSDVPLILIKEHRTYLTASDIEVIFPTQEQKILIDSTWFPMMSYNAKQKALYFERDNQLIRSTASGTKDMGSITVDDYSQIQTGINSDHILYTNTHFENGSDFCFSLIIKTNNHDFLTIAPHTTQYQLSSDGEILYYLDLDQNIVQYDLNSQTEQTLATGYTNFYYHNESELLLLQQNDQTTLLFQNKKIPISNKIHVLNEDTVQLHDDTLYLLADQTAIAEDYHQLALNLGDSLEKHRVSGNLYTYSKNEEKLNLITSKNIIQFEFVNDDLYLLTIDHQLFKLAGKNSLKLLADQVLEIFPLNDALLYATEKAELIKMKNDQSSSLSDKIELQELPLLRQAVKNNGIVFITEDRQLHINEAIFEQPIETAVYENGIVVTLTENNIIYYLHPRTGEELMVIDNIDLYDEIYVGQQQLRYREYVYPDENLTTPEPITSESNSSNLDTLYSLAQSKTFSDAFKQQHFNNLDGYILEDSCYRTLNIVDLAHYTLDELALIRNEIFARSGYLFDNELYQAYFNSKSWYSGYTKEVFLTDIQKENIEFLNSLESNEEYHSSTSPSGDVPLEYLNKLSSLEALEILNQAYSPIYIGLRYNGITEDAFDWYTGTTRPAFNFLFMSTEYDTDNLYVGFVFEDGTYIFKHAPIN